MISFSQASLAGLDTLSQMPGNGETRAKANHEVGDSLFASFMMQAIYAAIPGSIVCPCPGAETTVPAESEGSGTAWMNTEATQGYDGVSRADCTPGLPKEAFEAFEVAGSPVPNTAMADDRAPMVSADGKQAPTDLPEGTVPSFQEIPRFEGEVQVFGVTEAALAPKSSQAVAVEKETDKPAGVRPRPLENVAAWNKIGERVDLDYRSPENAVVGSENDGRVDVRPRPLENVAVWNDIGERVDVDYRSLDNAVVGIENDRRVDVRPRPLESVATWNKIGERVGVRPRALENPAAGYEADNSVQMGSRLLENRVAGYETGNRVQMESRPLENPTAGYEADNSVQMGSRLLENRVAGYETDNRVQRESRPLGNPAVGYEADHRVQVGARPLENRVAGYETDKRVQMGARPLENPAVGYEADHRVQMGTRPLENPAAGYEADHRVQMESRPLENPAVGYEADHRVQVGARPLENPAAGYEADHRVQMGTRPLENPAAGYEADHRVQMGARPLENRVAGYETDKRVQMGSRPLENPAAGYEADNHVQMEPRPPANAVIRNEVGETVSVERTYSANAAVQSEADGRVDVEPASPGITVVWNQADRTDPEPPRHFDNRLRPRPLGHLKIAPDAQPDREPDLAARPMESALRRVFKDTGVLTGDETGSKVTPDSGEAVTDRSLLALQKTVTDTVMPLLTETISAQNVTSMPKPEKSSPLDVIAIAKSLRSESAKRLPRSVEVRLEPPHLGSMTVLLTKRGQDVTVKIAIDNTAGQNALVQTADDLGRALEAEGLVLAGFSVDPEFGGTQKRGDEPSDRGTPPRKRRTAVRAFNGESPLVGRVSERLFDALA